ncbi:IclR family transcriptional regulator [Pseudonocardia dioxanivorans]|jgi:DNA-binding IclR family transcriptional regulator|uniref:IclR family transcriptional regulator n=1 Tax=Pseudonocardia dioxanivorans TaxID=240495 RepID=UPI00131A57DD|nr:IclR family transcriptional regulator [Pseudonocardia dioxanivorans]
MTADGGGLTSVDRALQIIELLGKCGAVRVMDVADHLGVARSTAHRLLSALLRREFVVQDATKVYHRGPAFVAAGFGTERNSLVRAVVRPHLEALARQAGETCHLVVLEGNGARFIDAVESDQTLRVGSRIGMLLPAHTTAAGKALLAELSQPDFFALYPRGLPGLRAELAKRTTLQRELAMVRRRGWATNIDESERGITAVAVAIKDEVGLALASIAIACPSARCPRSRMESLVEMVKVAAAGAQTTLHQPVVGAARP